MGRTTVEVGVVGTGWAAEVLLPALRDTPDVEVVAVCSARLERAEQAAERFGIGIALDDVGELIGLAPDLVCIATPPATHHEMALAAVEAGRNVFLTKPLGATTAEARKLRDLAHERGLTTAIDLGGRYLPVFRYIRDLVAQGHLGELRLVSCTRYAGASLTPGTVVHYANWASREPHGGLLRTSFHHLVDRMRFLFGEIDTVSGVATTLVKEKPVLGEEHTSTYGLDETARILRTEPVDADDAVLLQGSFVGGALLSIGSTWAVPNGSGERMEVYGSAGALVLDNAGVLHGALAGGPLEVLAVPDTYALATPPPEPMTPAELLYGRGRRHLYGTYMRDLADIVRGGEGTGLHPTFDDGVRLAEIQETVTKIDAR
ncbi:Gfo/Idh/MocA family oxidoreductase [Pseudonocardia ailaonensis]|uniref:Gfo/Idh/MocA family oxidoreductase n=1 Tax=Pseudonocardia ailaonensis TaxID=367279 RepID=A0ABN2MJ76_9PSEU